MYVNAPYMDPKGMNWNRLIFPLKSVGIELHSRKWSEEVFIFHWCGCCLDCMRVDWQIQYFIVDYPMVISHEYLQENSLVGGPSFSNRACMEVRIWYFPAIEFGMNIKQLLVKNMYRAVLTCTVETLYEHCLWFIVNRQRHGVSLIWGGGGWEDKLEPNSRGPSFSLQRLRMVQRPSVSDACVPSVTGNQWNPHPPTCWDWEGYWGWQLCHKKKHKHWLVVPVRMSDAMFAFLCASVMLFSTVIHVWKKRKGYRFA